MFEEFSIDYPNIVELVLVLPAISPETGPLERATQNYQKRAKRLGLKFHNQHQKFYISGTVLKFKITMMYFLLK